MNRFRQYLWKEWRDNRAIAIGILAAVPALVVLASFFLPESLITDELFVHVCAWGTLAITVLALGSDLVPAETRRGRMAFLARLPSDLTFAFAAKVVVLMLAIVLSTTYGFLVGSMVAGWPDSGMKLLAGPLLLVLCASPWIFAVSCWLPRGALALPATALALALFALPFYVVVLWFPAFRPTDGDFLFWGVALGVGAFVVAWISFTRGYRYGRGFLSAGWRGMLATLVLVAPAYAYTGYRVHEWSTVDPESDNFRVRHFMRGESGRYLYVNAHMLLRDGKRASTHALVVDTRDGTWRSVGGAGAHFMSLENFGHWNTVPVVVIEDLTSVTDALSSRGGKKIWRNYYDTDTGEVFKSGWSNMTLPEVEERIARGRSEVLKGWSRQWSIGLGSRVVRGREVGIYDPFRDKIFPSLGNRLRVAVRPGRWLVRGIGRKEEWKLYDPETGEFSESPLAREYLRFLPDGRILQVRKKQWTVLDPESGRSAPIRAEEGAALNQCGSWYFRVWVVGKPVRVMRLDPDTLTLHKVAGVSGSFEPLLVNEQWLLGREEDRRIVRIDVATGERKVIFPR